MARRLQWQISPVQSVVTERVAAVLPVVVRRQKVPARVRRCLACWDKKEIIKKRGKHTSVDEWTMNDISPLLRYKRLSNKEAGNEWAVSVCRQPPVAGVLIDTGRVENDDQQAKRKDYRSSPVHALSFDWLTLLLVNVSSSYWRKRHIRQELVRQ